METVEVLLNGELFEGCVLEKVKGRYLIALHGSRCGEVIVASSSQVKSKGQTPEVVTFSDNPTLTVKTSE